MAVDERTTRDRAELLHLSPRTIVLLVGGFGLALALLRLLDASQRVLGWMLAAGAIAGLLHPTVVFLSRHVPRGLAVLMVVVVALGTTAAVVYAVADDVVSEGRRLQEAIPRRAAVLEQEGRFSGLAREIGLAGRAERIVAELPRRLQGGTPADAIRSATTRGVAFLATAVFALFLLLHGQRLARTGIGQIHDDRLRRSVARVAAAAYRRGFAYARGSLAMAILAGIVAYVVCIVADVPGAAALALWVAAWDVVPFVGALLGAVPIVVLAGAVSPPAALIALAVMLLFQVLESVFLQPHVERQSVRVGAFLTVVAVLGGLEVYGLGGAVIAVLAVAVAAAALDELAPAA